MQKGVQTWSQVIFWLALMTALVCMVIGHVKLQGQAYDAAKGIMFNWRTNYVSEYAGKWPEGLWIKASIMSFCTAIALFCNSCCRATRELTTGPLLFVGTLFWLIVCGLMVMGLALVSFFDMLPPSYLNLREVARSPEEWSMRWYHNLGFKLLLPSYLAAAIAFLLIELKCKFWMKAAWTVFLLILTYFAQWWLSSGTLVPGVPQRMILIIMATWLACSIGLLARPVKVNNSRS